MSFFKDGPIDFSMPDPIIKWETKCPICRQNIFFIDNSKAPNYWEDMAKERLKQLKTANELFLKMDDWCMENIGNTYLQSKLKEIYDKFNSRENP